MGQQLAQQNCLLADLQAQGIFGGLQRTNLVTQTANAADTRSDDGRFVEAAPLEHGFEITGRFNNLQLRFFQHTLFHVHHDIAVAFHAGQGFDIYIQVCAHSDRPSNSLAL